MCPRYFKGASWPPLLLVRIDSVSVELWDKGSPISLMQGGCDCLWDGVGAWLSRVLEEHGDLTQNPNGMEWTHSIPEEGQALCRGEVGPEGVLRETHDLGDLLWVEEASSLRGVN